MVLGTYAIAIVETEAVPSQESGLMRRGGRDTLSTAGEMEGDDPSSIKVPETPAVPPILGEMEGDDPSSIKVPETPAVPPILGEMEGDDPRIIE
jgi:hypothetical protein